MLPGSKRGPKDKKWTKTAACAFADHFAKRSEPLPAAESLNESPLIEVTGAGLKWLFSSCGSEPTQVRAAEGAPVRNIVLGITGALLAIGVGQEPGIGTCHAYWALDNLEVPEGTTGAVRRVRGGTGDLQLRLAEGTSTWCSGHHCRPWEIGDGELPPTAAPLLPPHVERPPSPLPPLRSASPEQGTDMSDDDDLPPPPPMIAPLPIAPSPLPPSGLAEPEPIASNGCSLGSNRAPTSCRPHRVPPLDLVPPPPPPRRGPVRIALGSPSPPPPSLPWVLDLMAGTYTPHPLPSPSADICLPDDCSLITDGG